MECKNYRVRKGSVNCFSDVLINFLSTQEVEPLAQEFARALEEILGQPVSVKSFAESTTFKDAKGKPNFRGEYALFNLSAPQIGDFRAYVSCEGRTGNWAAAALKNNIPGFDANLVLSQYADRHLHMVSE